MPIKLEDNPGLGASRSLSSKVSKGALWVTAAGISARSLNLVSAVILARLLAPEDFGLMAIAMSIIAFSQGSTQTGFESALIQKQDRPEEFLNTAWTFELSRYLIIFIIIFLAAPWMALFFNEPRAMVILRVISISIIFQGLRNIGVVYFRKNLDFHKQFVLEIAPMVVYISLVIPLAYILGNVWALIWASLANQIFSCALSYVMHSYRPRLEFNAIKAMELFKFGRWILGSSIIVMIREQGMNMFIAKFLGIPMLGFYNRAGTFSNMIFQQVSEIVWKVGYPAYSELHVNPVRYKKAYLKTLKLLTFIGIPMAGGLFVLSWDFVHLFLTDKWLPIVPLMQILCLQAIFNFINTPAGIAFQASGKPAIGTRISTFGVITLIISIYPLSSRWGLMGAAFALLLSVLVTSPIIWFKAIQLMKCSLQEFFKPIVLPVMNTVIMGLSIYALKLYFLHQVNVGVLFVLILFGITIYVLNVFLLDRFMNYGMMELIKDSIYVLKQENT